MFFVEKSVFGPNKNYLMNLDVLLLLFLLISTIALATQCLSILMLDEDVTLQVKLFGMLGSSRVEISVSARLRCAEILPHVSFLASCCHLK